MKFYIYLGVKFHLNFILAFDICCIYLENGQTIHLQTTNRQHVYLAVSGHYPRLRKPGKNNRWEFSQLPGAGSKKRKNGNKTGT